MSFFNSSIRIPCVTSLFIQLFKHSPLFQHFQTDICPTICAACASGLADMYMERIYIAIFDRHRYLHFMESPIKRRTVDWNWSFGDKGYVFVEVIYRRANNIKLLNEVTMVKSFECSVITRNMICHNVEEVWVTSQTELTSLTWLEPKKP